MLILRAFARIAAGTLGVIAGAPLVAADGAAAGALQAASLAGLHAAPRESHDASGERKRPPQKQDKAKRPDKEGRRRIVTYNLYHDPVFKLSGAISDRSRLGQPPQPPQARFGSASGAAFARSDSPPPGTPLLKLQEPESSGIAFGCRDKPQPALPKPAKVRELTACYKHNVDRAWKAQTYLSHEYADGTQRWGGGMALRYAY